MELLRQLEGARQKKPKAPPAGSAGPDSRLLEGDEISQELVDRTWDAVRDAECSPKQVRRWRDLQLDDYETDMARYVLLALLRCCREQQGLQSGTHANSRRLSGTEAEENASSNADVVGVNGRGLESRTFFSLQTNELSLLRACPEILKHQTRIYQLLKGRFASNIAASSVSQPPSRSGAFAASSPSGTHSSADERRQHAPANDSGLPLADAVTIANVRTILGVDPGNSFGIWEVPLMEESECLGFAVYPIASFFNHREWSGPMFCVTHLMGFGRLLAQCPQRTGRSDIEIPDDASSERGGGTMHQLWTRRGNELGTEAAGTARRVVLQMPMQSLCRRRDRGGLLVAS